MENPFKTFIKDAVKAYETDTSNHGNRAKTLPISKIDNVECDVEVVLCREYKKMGFVEYYWALFINHSYLCLAERVEEEVNLFKKHFRQRPLKPHPIDEVLMVEGIMKELDNVILYLAKLRLNRLYGVFHDPKEGVTGNGFDEQVVKLLKSEMEKSDNVIKMKIGECCVCYTQTYTKTSCEHYVCMGCISNLSKCECDECDCFGLHCPMCRQDFNTLGYVRYDWKFEPNP